MAGLATADQYTPLRQVLTTSFYASPYMEKYVLEALFLMDDPEAALERMDERYAAMVESPLSTLWERWTLDGASTCNHAWAGGPLTLLSQYAAGVAPLAAAWESYQVLPREGLLTSLDAAVPSVRGTIEVAILKRGRMWILELKSPSGTGAIVGIPRRSFIDRGLDLERIEIAGTVVWEQGPVASVPGIDYRGENEGRVFFDAEPGTWRFVAISEAMSISMTASRAATSPLGRRLHRRQASCRDSRTTTLVSTAAWRSSTGRGGARNRSTGPQVL